jgi:serine/threonine protein kinase
MVDSEVQNNFNKVNWYYINEMIWRLLSNNKYKRFVYQGKKEVINKYAIIKHIKINPDNKNHYLLYLKEIYFLACVKKSRYFAEIIDVFTSEDCQNLFIVLKDEGFDLIDLINSKEYKKIPDIIINIIFSITCGLKILHRYGLSHNDIKPGNIIISATGQVKICDMGSTDNFNIIRKFGFGTNCYYSPQNLVGKERTQKDDMWALGVVFLEFLVKKEEKEKEKEEKKEGSKIEDQKKKVWYEPLFYFNGNNEKEKLLIDILKNFYKIGTHGRGLNQKSKDSDYNEVVNYIKDNEYTLFESKFNFDKYPFIKDDYKIIIENLLEIDPNKRWDAEKVFKFHIFDGLRRSFNQPNIDYLKTDYDKYFLNLFNLDVNDFKKYLEDIKQKFLGNDYSSQLNNIH